MCGCGSSDEDYSAEDLESTTTTSYRSSEDTDSDEDSESQEDTDTYASGDANVHYSNPNTGTQSDYNLDVDYDSDGDVERINFNNGGWIDDSHITDQSNNGDTPKISYCSGMKLLCLFVLLVGSIHVHAQNLSFDQLVLLKKAKNVEQVHDLLQSKGWRFSQSDPGEKYDQVVWVWQKDDDTPQLAIINLFICKQECEVDPVTSLTYRFSDTQYYTSIKARLKQMGISASSYVYPSHLLSEYTGANYTLRLSSYPTGSEMNARYMAMLENRKNE